MNKNTLIIIIITLIVAIVGTLIFLNRDGHDQREQLMLEQNLLPIELSQEEKQALQDEGLTIPSGEDALVKDLQSVRTSDELDAIEADINETDLSGLDADLDAITADLFEL